MGEYIQNDLGAVASKLNQTTLGLAALRTTISPVLPLTAPVAGRGAALAAVGAQVATGGSAFGSFVTGNGWKPARDAAIGGVVRKLIPNSPYVSNVIAGQINDEVQSSYDAACSSSWPGLVGLIFE